MAWMYMPERPLRSTMSSKTMRWAHCHDHWLDCHIGMAIFSTPQADCNLPLWFWRQTWWSVHPCAAQVTTQGYLLRIKEKSPTTHTRACSLVKESPKWEAGWTNKSQQGFDRSCEICLLHSFSFESPLLDDKCIIFDMTAVLDRQASWQGESCAFIEALLLCRNPAQLVEQETYCSPSALTSCQTYLTHAAGKRNVQMVALLKGWSLLKWLRRRQRIYLSRLKSWLPMRAFQWLVRHTHSWDLERGLHQKSSALTRLMEFRTERMGQTASLKTSESARLPSLHQQRVFCDTEHCQCSTWLAQIVLLCIHQYRLRR